MATDTIQGAQPSVHALQQMVDTAFAEAPFLYANGFVNGLGLTDAYIVLQANARPVAVVNLSMSVAKTLGQNLLAMIESYEQHTNQTVPTVDELQQLA